MICSSAFLVFIFYFFIYLFIIILFIYLFSLFIFFFCFFFVSTELQSIPAQSSRVDNFSTLGWQLTKLEMLLLFCCFGAVVSGVVFILRKQPEARGFFCFFSTIHL